MKLGKNFFQVRGGKAYTQFNFPDTTTETDRRLCSSLTVDDAVCKHTLAVSKKKSPRQSLALKGLEE